METRSAHMYDWKRIDRTEAEAIEVKVDPIYVYYKYYLWSHVLNSSDQIILLSFNEKLDDKRDS